MEIKHIQHSTILGFRILVSTENKYVELVLVAQLTHKSHREQVTNKATRPSRPKMSRKWLELTVTLGVQPNTTPVSVNTSNRRYYYL